MFKEESLSEKLIKKGFWLYLFTFFIAPTGYIVRVIISNSISIEEVGIIYSLIGLMTFVSIYNDIGLNESLRYFLPRFWVKKDYNSFKTAIYLSGGIKIFVSILMTLAFYLLSGFIAEHYLHTPSAVEVVKIFSFYFLVTNIYEIFISIYSAFQDTFNEKLLEFIKMWGTVILAIIFYFIGYSSLIAYSHTWFWGMVLAVLVSGIIFIVQYSKYLKLGKFHIDKKIFKGYFKYSLLAFAGANIGMLFGLLDQQVVIYFLGPEQAGYYSNYLSLMNIYIVIISPILGFIFAVTSELHSKDKLDQINFLKNFFYKYVTFFCLSLGSFFMVFGREISAILYGEKFIFSGHLLQFSGIFILLNALYSLNFNIMAGIGIIKERLKIIAYALIINLVSMLLLINILGIYGAIIGMIIGRFVIAYMSQRLLNKVGKADFDMKFQLKNIFFIIIFLSIAFFFRSDLFVLKDSFRFQNLIYLASIGIAYFVYLLALNYKEMLLFKNEILKTKNSK